MHAAHASVGASGNFACNEDINQCEHDYNSILSHLDGAQRFSCHVTHSIGHLAKRRGDGAHKLLSPPLQNLQICRLL